MAILDDADQRLIALLRRDSRMSVSDLAQELGLSRGTVRARIARLTGDGTIAGFTVLLREDAAQNPVRGLMMLGIEGRGTDRIIHRLTGLPAVQAVHTTNGKWDLIAEIGTDTLEALDAVLAAIRRIEGVVTSETSLLLTTRRAARAR